MITTLNKNTDVYSIYILNIDVLYDYVLPFFKSLTFLTRKSIDFHYWAISVRMHKFGYSYLSQGRQLALQISMSTNKYRYTTSLTKPVELPTPESIAEIFSLPAPFDIYSGSSHLELAKC